MSKYANILPIHESPKILADNFATFLDDEKVQKLHGGFDKIVSANFVVESLTSHPMYTNYYHYDI